MTRAHANKRPDKTDKPADSSEFPAVQTTSATSAASASADTSKRSGNGLAFIGVRIPKDVHQRLYRAKASLEFETGKFYGMGRLIERVIRLGLAQIERELGTSAGLDVDAGADK